MINKNLTKKGCVDFAKLPIKIVEEENPSEKCVITETENKLNNDLSDTVIIPICDIKLSDIKLILKVRGVIINLTDEELIQFINLELKLLLDELGVSLEPMKHKYTLYNRYHVHNITLPLRNVVSIDKIIIHGKHTHKNYFLDENNGLIYFPKPIHFPHNPCEIYYTTALTDENIWNKIIALLYNILTNKLTPDNQSKDIKNIDEGDVAIGFDRDKSIVLGNNLDKELDDIKSLLCQPTTMMI